MREPIVVTSGVIVPEDAIEVRAVRSSGPGGQNVNKVSSKIELRVDLWRVRGLDPAQRARLAALAAGRLDADGRLLVTSQRTRDQPLNYADACDKVRNLVRACLARPRPRVATKPTRASKERRIDEKKRRARRMSDRRADRD